MLRRGDNKRKKNFLKKFEEGMNSENTKISSENTKISFKSFFFLIPENVFWGSREYKEYIKNI